MEQAIKYRVYPTLLDAYSRYLRAEELHDRRWGFADDGAAVPDFDPRTAVDELIGRINRVKFESEAADRGTAFNWLIDELNTERAAEVRCEVDRRCRMQRNYLVEVNGSTFKFKKGDIDAIAARYATALPQIYIERPLETSRGTVLLYGYIDELFIDHVVDLKTTTRFEVNKYRHNWQHIVYPYCLNQPDLRVFFYEVYTFDTRGRLKERNVDAYEFNPERDEPLLRRHVEGLIDFALEHRERITDKKFFNITDE